MSEIYGPPAKKSSRRIARDNAIQKAVASSYNLGLSNGMTGGAKWPHGLGNSGATTTINPAETIQNVRKLSHQSTQARGLMKRATDLTIDEGLKLGPAPNWRTLGITDDNFKEEWTKSHEERFHMYMLSKQCHRSRRLTGYQFQRRWQYHLERDNDNFGRMYYSSDKKLVSPVQIKSIDSTQIRGTAYIDSEGFQDWRDGISRKESGEEIGYLVRVKKKNGVGFIWKSVEIPAKGSRSGRVLMFHDYESEYSGQGRGFPKLHFAVQDFENIVDYMSANIKKAINQADMVGFVEPGKDAPASNPYESQQSAVPPIPDGTTVTTVNGEFVAVRDEYMNRTPGSDFIASLGPEEKIQFLKDTAPGPQFDGFITTICKYIHSARGWPLEVIIMGFNSNYSASRAALLEAWRTGRIEQANIKAGLMDVWWEMWLSEEIAAGRTQAPGWNIPALRQAWMHYSLQGPSLPSISPRDDVAAFETELKLSLNTQERIARNRNGSSANQNIIENTKMFEKSPTAFWVDEPKEAGEPEQPNKTND